MTPPSVSLAAFSMNPHIRDLNSGDRNVCPFTTTLCIGRSILDFLDPAFWKFGYLIHIKATTIAKRCHGREPALSQPRPLCGPCDGT